MTNETPKVTIELEEGVSHLAQEEWDALVGDASPFLEWAFLASSCGIDHPAVVINHAPRSVYAKAEIRAEVERVLEPSSIQFLPVDDRVRRAAWDGTVVRRGPFVRALGRAVGEWVSQ